MKQSDAFRKNVVERRTRMWRGRDQAAKRRAMEAAESPYSDEELVRQAVEAGKVKRLPAAPAYGGSMATNRKDWR